MLFVFKDVLFDLINKIFTLDLFFSDAKTLCYIGRTVTTLPYTTEVDTSVSKCTTQADCCAPERLNSKYSGSSMTLHLLAKERPNWGP